MSAETEKLELPSNCCLCGAPLPEGTIGRNNPWPLVQQSEDNLPQCCTQCNDAKVIPARIALMFSEEGDERCAWERPTHD